MDEWIRAIVGGLLGGGLASAVAWYKFRDDQLTRRRALLVDVYAAADTFFHSRTIDPATDNFEMLAGFGRARAALMLFETHPEILAKLKALDDVVVAIWRIQGPISQDEFKEKVIAPREDLRRCMRELLDTARQAYRTAGD